MTMGKAQQAVALHGRGCNCAQAVLCAFARDLGLEERAALRIATGFGGGMGRTGSTCGAVTGAYMVLGLARGMNDPEEKIRKDATYTLVREFADRFRKKHGALGCRELLGVDIGTAEGLKLAHEGDLFSTRCNTLIHDAVLVLQGVLKE
jgi:C_GCAxxG_C_C family probable redox protein